VAFLTGIFAQKKMVEAIEQTHTATGFLEFARMTPLYQARLLAGSGELLDVDFDNDRFIHLYFLDGFFVEVTYSPESGVLPEVIPFRNGYRLSSYRCSSRLHSSGRKAEKPFCGCGFLLLPSLN
jgi:hypothetical protein